MARPLLLPLEVAVTFDHDVLVDLFRQQPRLALELLRRCAGRDLPADHVELASIDLSQVTPIEYRADAMVVLRDADNQPTHAIVVEVQLSREPRKKFTWPVYLAVARASLECPVTLLVIAPELAVARWASAPSFLGGGFTFAPTVLSLVDLTTDVDIATALELPQLALLAALAHPTEQSLTTALTGIRSLADETSRVYLDLLELTLPAALWRMVMQTKKYEFRGAFAREHIAQGQQEGRAELLVEMLALRFGSVSDDIRDALPGVSAETAKQVASALVTNASLDEIRALVRSSKA